MPPFPRKYLLPILAALVLVTSLAPLAAPVARAQGGWTVVSQSFSGSVWGNNWYNGTPWTFTTTRLDVYASAMAIRVDSCSGGYCPELQININGNDINVGGDHTLPVGTTYPVWHCLERVAGACDAITGWPGGAGETSGNWITGTVSSTATVGYLIATWGASQTAAGEVYVVWGDGEAATATPVPATPLPTGVLPCVTPTAQPTSTRAPTPTPFGATPGPTSTPRPGATPSAPGFRVEADFAASLAPWSGIAHETAPTGMTWLADAGLDGAAGIARLQLDVFSVNHDPVFPTGLTGLAYATTTDMPKPIRVTGQGRWSGDPLGVGGTAYIDVWYLDPDQVTYDGQMTEITGGWVYGGRSVIGNTAWTILDVTLNPASRVRGIALVADSSWTGNLGTASAVVDNVVLYAGHEMVTGSYPICTGTGGTGGTSRVPTKICTIRSIRVDVFGSCTAPTSLADIGLWVPYLACRVEVYFKFVAENRQQLLEMRERGRYAEPMGTFVDMVDAFGLLRDTFASIFAVNRETFAESHSLDFSFLLDWSAIDSPPDMVASLNAPQSNDYMQLCDTRIAQVSQNAQQTACFVIHVIRRQGSIFALIQWALDVIALVIFFAYVRNSWLVTA